MELVWKQGLDTLTRALSYDLAQMISFFQDYFDNPSSAQQKIHVRITDNMFLLPASESILVYLLILWKEWNRFQ
jgi:hypothetical protein